MTTFRQNRQASCDFHNAFRTQVGQTRSTEFHSRIAKWQLDLKARSVHLTVMTQNVDDLFEKGGVTDVVHVHGDIRYMECVAFRHRWFVGDQPQDVATRCIKCNCSVCKPGVVFFNEAAPEYPNAFRLLKSLGRGDALVVLGTSCTVFPIDMFLENGRVFKVFSALDFPESLAENLFDKIILGPCSATIEDVIKVTEEKIFSSPEETSM